MPLRKEVTFTGGTDHGNPWVGPVNHTVSVPVDLSALTDDEIDEHGFVKPGVPLTKAGILVTVGVAVFGCTRAHTKVADDNEAATIAALGTVDITVGTIGQINQDLAEDILGRAYTADELAGFNLAGSKIVLL